MTIFLGLIGIVGAFFMLKYREFLGEMIGDAEWMHVVGGPYNLVVIIAIIVFLWSIAAMTGTQDIFLSPLLWLIPGGRQQPAIDGF